MRCPQDHHLQAQPCVPVIAYHLISKALSRQHHGCEGPATKRPPPPQLRTPTGHPNACAKLSSMGFLSCSCPGQLAQENPRLLRPAPTNLHNQHDELCPAPWSNQFEVRGDLLPMQPHLAPLLFSSNISQCVSPCPDNDQINCFTSCPLSDPPSIFVILVLAHLQLLLQKLLLLGKEQTCCLPQKCIFSQKEHHLSQSPNHQTISHIAYNSSTWFSLTCLLTAFPAFCFRPQ